MERFVGEGAKVVFRGRRAPLGRQPEKALGRERARLVQADVTLEADVARVIEACVKSFGMKHVAPLMMWQRGGSIINNGVVHLTTCVAMQLGESNVRVNCISPGGIAAGIFGKALGLPLEAAEKTADIASAAPFLASDASSFINGHNLVVDGGLAGSRQWSVAQKAYQGIRQAFGVK